jgi:hypothetical protein
MHCFTAVLCYCCCAAAAAAAGEVWHVAVEGLPSSNVYYALRVSGNGGWETGYRCGRLISQSSVVCCGAVDDLKLILRLRTLLTHGRQMWHAKMNMRAVIIYRLLRPTPHCCWVNCLKQVAVGVR